MNLDNQVPNRVSAFTRVQHLKWATRHFYTSPEIQKWRVSPHRRTGTESYQNQIQNQIKNPVRNKKRRTLHERSFPVPRGKTPTGGIRRNPILSMALMTQLK